jgi:curved DNA-binding protein CbpA
MGRRTSAFIGGIKKQFSAGQDESDPMEGLGQVEKQGYMLKKGEERSNWKKRWFVLSGPFLAYFKTGDEEDGKGKNRLGMIPLRACKIERFFHRRRKFCFRIFHKQRRAFYLACESEEEYFDWLDKLSHASVKQASIYKMTRYFDVLGLPQDATAAQIKKTYRKLALKNHPDKGGDKDKFQEITEAYEVVSSLKENQEEKAELEQGTMNVRKVVTLIKGPAGEGLGIHIGARYNRLDHENQVTILGVQGLAQATGEIHVDDILRKVGGHPLATLGFDDVITLLKEVKPGGTCVLELDRRVTKSQDVAPFEEEGEFQQWGDGGGRKNSDKFQARKSSARKSSAQAAFSEDGMPADFGDSMPSFSEEAGTYRYPANIRANAMQPNASRHSRHQFSKPNCAKPNFQLQNKQTNRESMASKKRRR